MKLSKAYVRQVFLNCPFDDGYRPIYEAIIFSVIHCGFVIRCAREREDSGEPRISKIVEIIRASQFGIHDISRVELDEVNHLPRFNMPLELGLFLGAKAYSSEPRQKARRCLKQWLRSLPTANCEDSYGPIRRSGQVEASDLGA